MVKPTTTEIMQRLKEGRPLQIHMLGIGGCGVSGLARLMAQAGQRVSGTDETESSETTALRHDGISVDIGHSSAPQNKPDLVVYSAAVTDGNPELVALKKAGAVTMRRGEFLAALMNERDGIAVAGMHGKTTTSAMIAHILRRAGLEPGYCVGGSAALLNGNSALGKGRWFVAEADESDGTLAFYKPRIGIVLNVEEEHLDYFKNLESIVSVFRTFAANCRGPLFYCADDEVASEVCRQAKGAVSFGLGKDSNFTASDLRWDKRGSSFTVTHNGKLLGRLVLQIPGTHNVINALAAFAVAIETGVEFDAVAAALAEFGGVKRRFEKKFVSDEYVVIDDYAHHPTEIRATISSARMLGRRRVVVAFQPHRYSRTKWLRPQFASSFAMADRLYLTDVYGAGEKPIKGVDGSTLYEAVRATRQQEVEYEPSLERLAERLAEETKPGDLVLVLGAGSITHVADRLARVLEKRASVGAAKLDMAAKAANTASAHISGTGANQLKGLLSANAVVRENEPMSQHTSLRVGGTADLWVEPYTEEDVAAVVKFCKSTGTPLLVIGGGTNLLVRDGGIRGIVLHLGRPPFSEVAVEGLRIRARAGARLRQIAMTAQDAGIAGLEFMEGIPACLGGALRMNAGAMGRSLFDVIESVRCLDCAGNVMELQRADIKAEYRCCALFDGRNGDGSHIALSAVLRGENGAPEQIRRLVSDYETRRARTQPKAPSAGCTFKNPSAEMPAGRLIDQMGCKGLRVGGARVSEVHANFIVTEKGATASDVLELMAMIQRKAMSERGVTLESEVQIVGEELQACHVG